MNCEEQLQKAEVAWRNNNYTEAEDYARSALSAQPDDTSRAKAFRILGAVSLTFGKHAQALDYFTQALELAEKLGNQSDIALTMGNIGSIYVHTADYPRALEQYQKALTLHQSSGNTKEVASITGNIGSVRLFLSDYGLALEQFRQALELAQNIENQSLIATNFGNIGLVYYYLSDYPRALEYYQQSVAINERKKNQQGLMSNLGNIGNLYLEIKDYPKALEYLNKALELSESLGNAYAVAASLGNIGNVYDAIAEYDNALEYYHKSVQLYEQIGNPIGVANNICNIGNVYKKLADYLQALEYYHKALHAMENIEQLSGVASIMGNIGSIYANPGFDGFDAMKAEELLLKAIAINEGIGTVSQNITVCQDLAELYEHQKRWEEFADFYKKYHRLEKEVQSEEATKEAQLMEHRRKVEEAERDRQIKLARFQEQEKILHKTLPPIIADRLISGEKEIADRYESVSILFADIVGFTSLSTRKTPREVVHILNNLFSRFDKLTEKYGVERIKTIGDAYMVVAGAPEVVEDHAFRLAQTAFGMLEEIAAFNAESGESINLRIGLNSGEAIAAVVGDVKFTYDLWSDAVNTASRMESHGEPGKIHVTEDFVKAVGESEFQFTERGEMDVKGKGLMKTYFLGKQ